MTEMMRPPLEQDENASHATPVIESQAKPSGKGAALGAMVGLGVDAASTPRIVEALQQSPLAHNGALELLPFVLLPAAGAVIGHLVERRQQHKAQQ